MDFRADAIFLFPYRFLILTLAILFLPLAIADILSKILFHFLFCLIFFGIFNSWFPGTPF